MENWHRRKKHSLQRIKNRQTMTSNPTKEEIEALEREVQRKRNPNVRRAVNPAREYDR
jgi:hypothetical protein